jgi:hypothetical protein
MDVKLGPSLKRKTQMEGVCEQVAEKKFERMSEEVA